MTTSRPVQFVQFIVLFSLLVRCRSEYNGTTEHATVDNVSLEISNLKAILNRSMSADEHNLNGENETEGCRLIPLDPFIHIKIRDKIDVEKVNLLEYRILFPNYVYDPLAVNATYTYRPNSWTRVSTRHGQTLLSLAFNYGVLSLMTLTFGTERMNIDVTDSPPGCITWERTESEKLNIVLYLLLRDFKVSGDVMLTRDERVCVEMIVADADGLAKVKDQCFMKHLTGSVIEIDIGNLWIELIYGILSTIRFSVIFFGPLLLIARVGGMSNRSVPYVVTLREPFIKTICLTRPSSNEEQKETATDQKESRCCFGRKVEKNSAGGVTGGKVGEKAHEVEEEREDVTKVTVKATTTFDLTKERGFPKLIRDAENVPLDKPIRVEIREYDILVNYRRLIVENLVPVGFWRSIARSIFLCKVHETNPFRECCRMKICRRHPEWRLTWLKLWKQIGLGLLVLLLPTPYYLRLIIFYTYEYDEVSVRKAAISALGLEERFENSLVHYLLPTHPLFIICYTFYALGALSLAYITRRGEDGHVRKIVVRSFADLHRLSWIKVLQVAVDNFIWPFRKFGMMGCVVAFVYFPIVLPLTILFYGTFALPTIYVIIRMFYYSRRAFVDGVKKKKGVRPYRVIRHADKNLELLQVETYFPTIRRNRQNKMKNSKEKSKREEEWDKKHSTEDLELETRAKLNRSIRPRQTPVELSVSASSMSVAQSFMKSPLKTFICISIWLLCTFTLLSCLVVISECVGCLVEMTVFTLMGVIVNAGTLLKYVSLVILVVVYSYDSFNNVEKKYLRLNKALFGEIKNRIRDLDKVTSLPAHLQENHGFKSQEQSEQGAHESPDDWIDRPPRQLKINDLTLFVDSEDMPRIPRRLFDDVCKIRVAGVPGPVYRGLLLGLMQFLKIAIFICFVFIVVLSFGDVYKVSSTNQMLATLAGGFLPVILRQFMEPERPDIEIGTVSFKSKLDETIKNFWQYWPVYDFQFKVLDSEPSSGDAVANHAEHTNNNETHINSLSHDSAPSNSYQLTTQNYYADDHEYPQSSDQIPGYYFDVSSGFGSAENEPFQVLGPSFIGSRGSGSYGGAGVGKNIGYSSHCKREARIVKTSHTTRFEQKRLNDIRGQRETVNEVLDSQSTVVESNNATYSSLAEVHVNVPSASAIMKSSSGVTASEKPAATVVNIVEDETKNSNKSEPVKVDLLIILPVPEPHQEDNGTWLKEWSDYDDDKVAVGLTIAEKAARTAPI